MNMASNGLLEEQQLVHGKILKINYNSRETSKEKLKMMTKVVEQDEWICECGIKIKVSLNKLGKKHEIKIKCKCGTINEAATRFAMNVAKNYNNIK